MARSPVVVLGAGGRTGAACVSRLEELGKDVRAVVRQGAAQLCGSGGNAWEWRREGGRSPTLVPHCWRLATCCLPGGATCRDPAKYGNTLGGKKGVELVAGDVTDVQVGGQLAAESRHTRLQCIESRVLGLLQSCLTPHARGCRPPDYY